MATSQLAVVFALIGTSTLRHTDLPGTRALGGSARSPLQIEGELGQQRAQRKLATLLDVERGYPTRTAPVLDVELQYSAPLARHIESEPQYPVQPTTLTLEPSYPEHPALQLQAEIEYPAIAAPSLAVENEYPAIAAAALTVENEYPSMAAGLQLEEQYPVTLMALLDVESQYPFGHSTVLQPEGDYPASRAIRHEPQGASDERAVRPAIALTFDTEIPYGEEARRTLTEVLDTLHTAGVRATFFVVGYWAQANPKMLRRLVADGHEVANHSFTHRSFSHRPPEELRAELHQVADIVRRETGAPIAPLFRPPYGCIDHLTALVARDDGYQLAGWTASGSDARRKTRDGDEVVAAVRHDLRQGAVVLLHTNRWITADALPEILRIIKERGLEAVPVSELLRRSPSTAARLAHGALRDCTLHTAKASHAARTTAY